MNNRSYVRKNNLQSESFDTKGSLRQGGVLSPLLFILMMDDIIKAIDKEKYKVHLSYFKFEPVGLAECAFADDLMVCATKEDELQEKLNV